MKKVSSKENIDIEDSQKCHICFRYYSSNLLPFVLKCGHTFCKNCVEKLYERRTQSVKCAFDKKEIGYENLDEIPINFTLLNLLQAVELLGINNKCVFESLPTEKRSSTIDIIHVTKEKYILDLESLRSICPKLSQAKDFFDKELKETFNSAYKLSDKKSVGRKIFKDGGFYEGEYFNNKFHGFGKKLTKNGNLYQGHFCEGALDGVCVGVLQGGDIYIGEFKNSLKSGKCTFWLKNSVYRGQMNGNKKNGYGEECFDDGCMYQGEYLDNVRHGQGKYTYSSGNYIQGNFVNGKLEGKGREVSSNFKYKGEYKEGLKHGFGIWVGNDGEMYKGDFEYDQRCGKGDLITSSESRYQGDFSSGVKHGFGKLETKDGCRYEGDFKHDLFDGYGKLVSSTGDEYEGDFYKGCKSGQGILKYKNGDIFIGTFSNDYKKGKGKFLKNGSNTYTLGIWQDDKVVEICQNHGLRTYE